MEVRAPPEAARRARRAELIKSPGVVRVLFNDGGQSFRAETAPSTREGGKAKDLRTNLWVINALCMRILMGRGADSCLPAFLDDVAQARPKINMNRHHFTANEVSHVHRGLEGSCAARAALRSDTGRRGGMSEPEVRAWYFSTTAGLFSDDGAVREKFLEVMSGHARAWLSEFQPVPREVATRLVLLLFPCAFEFFRGKEEDDYREHPFVVASLRGVELSDGTPHSNAVHLCHDVARAVTTALNERMHALARRHQRAPTCAEKVLAWAGVRIGDFAVLDFSSELPLTLRVTTTMLLSGPEKAELRRLYPLLRFKWRRRITH